MHTEPKIDANHLLIPRSIGIIMDGNRRWAKGKGLPTLEGHRVGYEKLRDVLLWSKEFGVANVMVYAFSTENWNRTKEEVSYLMDLFRYIITEMVTESLKKDTRLIFLGERSRLDTDIIAMMNDAEERTRHCSSLTLGIALSYGGRTEIIDAIRRIPKDRLVTLTEEEFAALLWTHEIPDPDLVIRTSGEERLSNFLTWQSAYSELFFVKTLWPDFTREDFKRILDEYAKRQRRFGT